MSQWKNTVDAANSVNWASRGLRKPGSGVVNSRANSTTGLFGNTTADAFNLDQYVGQFGAEVTVTANVSGESKKLTHVGWVKRREGIGGISSIPTVTLTVAGYANGERFSVSGGDSNAQGYITTSAAGNAASVTITSGGLFPNVSVATINYFRDKHLSTLTVTGSTAAFDNTDVIRVSNSANFTNASGTIATDGSGAITNAGITITGVGRFANVSTNAQIVIVAYAANGAASNGTGATFAGTIIPSTGTPITVSSAVLGGRAGRVTYETLVAMGSLVAGAGSNTAQLPIT